MTGWAVDRGAVIGTGVDAAYVYASRSPAAGLDRRCFSAPPRWASRDPMSAPRSAVSTNSGFSLTSPDWRLAATGSSRTHSAVTGAYAQQRAADIVVTGPVSHAAMWLDTPTQELTRGTSFAMSGWAVDLGAASGPGVDAVHVYAYPIVGGGFGSPVFVGAATYGGARPDVGAVFGSQFTGSAFSLNATLVPGSYRLVASARSTVTGTFNNAFAADVTIAGSEPDPQTPVADQR